MFAFSKIFWWIVEPSNLLLGLLILGTILLWVGARRTGRRLVTFVVLMFIVIAVLPFRSWLIEPLEDRFPRVTELPDMVSGIIVLGGAVSQKITQARDQVTLSDGAERMTSFVTLVRRFPEARVAFTGGSGSLTNQDLKETMVARRFFAEMGLDAERVVYEDESRNTFENAVFSHRLLNPKPDDRWVLITSAMHMPRAVGVFRKAGWRILPYPVDYTTSGKGEVRFGFSFIGGLGTLSTAMHEWIGLAAYWILDRTDTLYPAPIETATEERSAQ